MGIRKSDFLYPSLEYHDCQLTLLTNEGMISGISENSSINNFAFLIFHQPNPACFYILALPHPIKFLFIYGYLLLYFFNWMPNNCF